MHLGLGHEVQEVVGVLAEARLAGLAADRVPHEEALVETVDFGRVAVRLVVGGQLQVADLAGGLLVHEGAVVHRERRRPAQPVPVVGFDVARVALVDRTVEVAGPDVRRRLPGHCRALAVVGQVEAFGLRGRRGTELAHFAAVGLEGQHAVRDHLLDAGVLEQDVVERRVANHGSGLRRVFGRYAFQRAQAAGSRVEAGEGEQRQ